MSDTLNSSGWKPTGHRVLVKVTKVEEVTQGGIIIPKDVTKREQLGQDGGIVVEIGNTAYSDQDPLGVKSVTTSSLDVTLVNLSPQTNQKTESNTES